MTHGKNAEQESSIECEGIVFEPIGQLGNAALNLLCNGAVAVLYQVRTEFFQLLQLFASSVVVIVARHDFGERIIPRKC